MTDGLVEICARALIIFGAEIDAPTRNVSPRIIRSQGKGLIELDESGAILPNPRFAQAVIVEHRGLEEFRIERVQYEHVLVRHT